MFGKVILRIPGCENKSQNNKNKSILKNNITNKYNNKEINNKHNNKKIGTNTNGSDTETEVEPFSSEQLNDIFHNIIKEKLSTINLHKSNVNIGSKSGHAHETQANTDNINKSKNKNKNKNKNKSAAITEDNEGEIANSIQHSNNAINKKDTQMRRA